MGASEIRDHRINETIMEQVFFSLGCRFESVTVVLVMGVKDLQQELKCLAVNQF